MKPFAQKREFFIVFKSIRPKEFDILRLFF